MTDKNLQNNSIERRELLKNGLKTGAAVSAALTLPYWLMPALAQGETLVKFTDMPDDYHRGPAQPGRAHFQDTRYISTYSSNQDFYVVQHYNQPEIDESAFRLDVTGLVKKPKQFTLADLKRKKQVEMDIGFECGGNGIGMFHGLVGNAKWRGIRLVDVLKECRLQDKAKEIVFFGGDLGTETIRKKEVEQSFSRSLSVEDAMNEDILLAFEMNGEPLPLFHGKPLRLIVPGWYGVANAKWLSQIHVQDRRHMGRFMARDYVTLQHQNVGGHTRWVESSVAKMNLKSIIGRVSKNGDTCQVVGFILNDGTPIERVEVKVDDGPWQPAEFDKKAPRYAWKLFTYQWNKPTPGDHTVVSRVTDVTGHVQPTREELPEKVTYWEDFAQFPRKLRI